VLLREEDSATSVVLSNLVGSLINLKLDSSEKTPVFVHTIITFQHDEFYHKDHSVSSFQQNSLSDLFAQNRFSISFT
jgi:hypothetical protein